MPTSSRSCASKGCSSASRPYQHSYPYCWRSKTPIIFRAVEQFFIRIDDLRAQALAGDQGGALDPAVGGEPHLRHGGIAARLVHLAAAQLGCAAAGFLFERKASRSSMPGWIRKLADLVEKRGTNVWFELDDAGLAEELGLPEGTTPSQRHDRCLDRLRRFACRRPGEASRPARPRRHVSRSDRSASRLVPIVAHDERRAARSRALQDLCHARLCRRCRRQENFEVEQLQRSRWMPGISSANTAPISCGFG